MKSKISQTLYRMSVCATHTNFVQLTVLWHVIP